jgi:hypothetical protein
VSWERLDEDARELVNQGKGATLLRKGGLMSPIDEYLTQAEPGSEERRIYRCLQLVNNKLDFVIDQLVNRCERERPLDDVIEISGSGLKFITREPLSVGDLLRMDLLMPESFHYQMELLAEVVRVEQTEEGYQVAAGITAIDEEFRDAIVQAVFKKQRQEIRKDRDARSEDAS